MASSLGSLALGEVIYQIMMTQASCGKVQCEPFWIEASANNQHQNCQPHWKATLEADPATSSSFHMAALLVGIMAKPFEWPH